VTDSDFKVTSSWSGAEPAVTTKRRKRTAQPSGQPDQAAAQTTTHAVPARLARGPFQMLGLMALLGWAFSWAPEFLQPQGIRDLWHALEPLSAVRPGAVGDWTINNTMFWALCASGVLALAAYTPVRRARTVMLALAGALTIALVANLWPMRSSLTTEIPAVVISALCAGLALRAAWILTHTGAPTPPRVGWLPAVVLSLTGCIPLAIGRSVGGVSVPAVPTLPLDELLRGVGTRWTITLGVTVLFAASAVLQLIPPYRGRSIKVPVVVLVVAAIAGYAYVLPRVLG
jgi:hypothetical protein